MFSEIEEIESTLEASKKLVTFLNSKGIKTKPELSEALENISSLKSYIEKNCKEDIKDHFDGMDWEIEDNLGLTLLMCVVLPENSNRLWFESYDDGGEEDITEDLLNEIAGSTNGEWKLDDLEMEMDEDEESLRVSFSSFGEEHEWELKSPIVDELVSKLKSFSDKYLKNGKLFINPAEEEIPIFYLPEVIVNAMNEEFSVEF